MSDVKTKEISEIEMLFANKIMNIMNDAIEIVSSNSSNIYDDKLFEMIKELSSLTVELINEDDLCSKIKDVARKSHLNGDNIDDKFETFKMIRNVIHHFPIFDKWDDVYITEDLISWNDPKGNQIKKYFSAEREFSYNIFLKESDKWELKHTINIKTPILGKNSKIYLKDIISLENAVWTFGTIDYYLQFVGLNIEQRILISL